MAFQKETLEEEKANPFAGEKINMIDYKDVALLRKVYL